MITSKNDPLANDELCALLDGHDPGDLMVDLITVCEEVDRYYRLSKELKEAITDAVNTQSGPRTNDLINLLKMLKNEDHLTRRLDLLCVIVVRLKEARDDGSLERAAHESSRRMVSDPDKKAGTSKSSG